MDWGFVMVAELFVLPGVVLDYLQRREEYRRWWSARPRWRAV